MKVLSPEPKARTWDEGRQTIFVCLSASAIAPRAISNSPLLIVRDVTNGVEVLPCSRLRAQRFEASRALSLHAFVASRHRVIQAADRVIGYQDGPTAHVRSRIRYHRASIAR